MKKIRVLMLPQPRHFHTQESGIRRVVEAYARYFPQFDIELVHPDSDKYDLKAVHAGMTAGDCDIAHLHGLYWTEDYHAPGWEYSSNRNIVEALRVAEEVTVPSRWVLETFQRDMRFSPTVIPHGIEAAEWEHNEPIEGYVLWNKNRNMDVCDPTPMIRLATAVPRVQFVSTQKPDYITPTHNVQVIGTKKHGTMKKLIQRAGVYLSTTKETFGIGTLEAMASGVPILGFDWGGNQDLVQHGVNGYLAQDPDDLIAGLQYCLEHRETLGANGREMAKTFTWEKAVAQIRVVYDRALEKKNQPHDVSVIIPCYNYGSKLEGAVQSVIAQTTPAKEIIIVDDGSTDSTPDVGRNLESIHPTVRYVHQPNAGVAFARNTGIDDSTGRYIVCLDADDRIAPKFIEACLDTLIKEPAVGIAYTGLMAVRPDGTQKPSRWPPEFDYNQHIRLRSKDDLRGELNQIPTCCMFRREIYDRTGGYKQRYAPLGAGAEDAEFWTRACAIGYNAKKVTDAPLFLYSDGEGIVSGFKGDPNLREPQWLDRHPWARDGRHPFASVASPANGISHPVRQYDQPDVSVIIPVGDRHARMGVYKNALDSLEAQTFRTWEAIVVWDSEVAIPENAVKAYPYVRFVTQDEPIGGAGAARNLGAKMARADHFVFLDADDELHSNFLQHTMDTWERFPTSIVYTDYWHDTPTTAKDLANFPQQDVLAFNEATGRAIIKGRSADYNCEKAQAPMDGNNVYHWCLVTCLIPRVYHEAIGGFDETMETFEDVLYHWKLARLGHCYVRLEESLVGYRMDTSTRRELANMETTAGLDKARAMLNYAKQQLLEVEVAQCKTCPGSQIRHGVNVIKELNSATQQANQSANDADYVLVEYTYPGQGKHSVEGMGTGTSYGYRQAGDRFLVHKSDIEAQPHYFKPVDEHPTPPKIERASLGAPVALNGVQPTAPVVKGASGTIIAVDEAQNMPIDPVLGPEVKEDENTPAIDTPDRVLFAELNVDTLPGMNVELATALKKAGITTKDAILALGVDGMAVYNVPASRAAIILDAVATFNPQLPTPTPA